MKAFARPHSVGLPLVLILLFSQAAPAQQVSPWEHDQTWDFGVFGTAATGEETKNSFAQAQTWTAGVFAGKTLTDKFGKGWRAATFEYGFSLVPVFVQTRIQTLYGGGFEPVILRFNSTHHLGRAVPYIELAGGGLFTRANLPPGNTSDFNFTARGGGGVQLLRNPSQSLDVGCRWFHASNANLGIQNPEFNGIQISFSYHWYK